MLPPKTTGSTAQQKLIKVFRRLSKTDQQGLLSYAEFLLQRTDTSAQPPSSVSAEPVHIPRPAKESVVAAMRRLTRTFPMLEKDDLLHEASALMSAHVMQGRTAVEVIDDLEDLFRRHHERVDSGE